MPIKATLALDSKFKLQNNLEFGILNLELSASTTCEETFEAFRFRMGSSCVAKDINQAEPE